MRLRPWIIILPLLCWAWDIQAQVPQGFSSVPEQWQLTLEVIKSKAQSLMVQNNGLQIKFRHLLGQVQKLQRSIYDQQFKNEQMERFLKERHGKTDQQIRIEELTQTIKIKKQQAQDLEEQLENLKHKKLNLDHTNQMLRNTLSGMEFRQQTQKEEDPAPQQLVQTQEDEQLTQLRKQLEDENKQEVLLENELGNLKNSDKMQNLDADTINEENKKLEARMDILRLQIVQYKRQSSQDVLARANGHLYYQLKKRKDLLVANINAYEMRLDGLRESSLMALSWPLKKKKLIHAMVQTDAHNNQMRDKIKVLREDIDVLKDQVSKLERRVDFGQDKFTDLKSTP